MADYAVILNEGIRITDQASTQIGTLAIDPINYFLIAGLTIGGLILGGFLSVEKKIGKPILE